jgi:hypothetical protein
VGICLERIARLEKSIDLKDAEIIILTHCVEDLKHELSLIYKNTHRKIAPLQRSKLSHFFDLKFNIVANIFRMMKFADVLRLRLVCRRADAWIRTFFEYHTIPTLEHTNVTLLTALNQPQYELQQIQLLKFHAAYSEPVWMAYRNDIQQIAWNWQQPAHVMKFLDLLPLIFERKKGGMQYGSAGQSILGDFPRFQKLASKSPEFILPFKREVRKELIDKGFSEGDISEEVLFHVSEGLALVYRFIKQLLIMQDDPAMMDYLMKMKEKANCKMKLEYLKNLIAKHPPAVEKVEGPPL